MLLRPRLLGLNVVVVMVKKQASLVASQAPVMPCPHASASYLHSLRSLRMQGPGHNLAEAQAQLALAQPNGMQGHWRLHWE